MQSRVFDDLHTIICINKLLGIEVKYVSAESSSSSDPQRFLPVSYYGKIYKLLRILIIHCCHTVEATQNEVYVQNQDIFMEVLQICLKYITHNSTGSSNLVPYHLLSLLLQLINKITLKSKAIDIAVPIS